VLLSAALRSALPHLLVQVPHNPEILLERRKSLSAVAPLTVSALTRRGDEIDVDGNVLLLTNFLEQKVVVLLALDNECCGLREG